MISISLYIISVGFCYISFSVVSLSIVIRVTSFISRYVTKVILVGQENIIEETNFFRERFL